MKISGSRSGLEVQAVPAKLFPQDLRDLLEVLHREFEGERRRLLDERQSRQRAYDAGALPGFDRGHPAVTETWSVAPIPRDLLDRRVEITGPISSTKMVIGMLSANAEGERACTAMLDFEDSMAPTWENTLAGLRNVIGVARGELAIGNYRLDPARMAHPMVRVRGLHMTTPEVEIDGAPIASGLLDLAATAYHTAREFVTSGKTPKFYVPKCEHHMEARWWNRLFGAVEHALGLARGTLRATFLIETLPAAFQMEEILYEIRERACGLNGGRWDKIFSDIKTLRMHGDRVLANRGSIDMTRPWMDNYAKLLIKTCHAHGAFAMGGMSAFTPGKDAQTREGQVAKVMADKEREARIGHDGCWVSHPFFIGIAKAKFPTPNQLGVSLEDFPEHPDLLPRPDGPKTLEGLRQNIRVGVAYQRGWNAGQGCIAFENLMEDLATLEISRAQTWQWLRHRVRLDDGTEVTPALVSRLFDEECARVVADTRAAGLLVAGDEKAFEEAKEQARAVFLKRELPDFFTV